MTLYNKLDLVRQGNSDIKYERITYPDGQDHIKVLSAVPPIVHIITSLNSASELFVLLITTELLRNLGARRISLEITYLLGARMDRRMSPQEPLTLKVVAKLINQQNYFAVEIFDPHSEVSLTLIDRSTVVPTLPFISGVLNQIKGSPWLVAPDAGATKKTDELGQVFNLEVVHGTKNRSKQTGYISNFKIDREDLEGKDCLVVDDICDGGATFVGLAKVLQEHNAGKLYLAVSHGIFSKGLKPLSMYERVFTTNSYKAQPHHEKLTTYNFW